MVTYRNNIVSIVPYIKKLLPWVLWRDNSVVTNAGLDYNFSPSSGHCRQFYCVNDNVIYEVSIIFSWYTVQPSSMDYIYNTMDVYRYLYIDRYTQFLAL